MKSLLIAFIFSNIANATVLKDCGQYFLKGTIIKNKTEIGYSFVLNQGTKSEHKFKIKIEDELKIAPYINKSIALTATVESVVNQMGAFASIENAELGFVEKLDPSQNTKLIKKMECKK